MTKLNSQKRMKQPMGRCRKSLGISDILNLYFIFIVLLCVLQLVDMCRGGDLDHLVIREGLIVSVLPFFYSFL